MFAEAVDFDISYDHHVVGVGLEYGTIDDGINIGVVSGGEKTIGGGHTLGGFA